MESRLRKALGEAAATVDPAELRPLIAPRRRAVFAALSPARPLALTAAAVAVAVAAGAIVVTTRTAPGTPGEQNPPIAASAPATKRTTVGGTGASPAATRIDARSFLLAAADTAMRVPAASGDYWYVRERATDRAYAFPEEFWAGVRKLQAAEQAEVDKIDPEADSDRLVEINEKYNKKLAQLRESIYPDGFPYTAYRVQIEEQWRPKRAGDTHRTKVKDVKVVFASPQDEAKWKELGAPKLLENKPRSTDDNLPRPLSISNMNITMQNVGRLPTSKKALAAQLRAQFESLPDADKEYDLYLWQTTVDLMTAPTTPGTRAALFRILADRSDITSDGEVKDAIGRTGVGLSVRDNDGVDFRLVIDEDTANLLEYAVIQKDDVSRVTFEELGWTDKLGRRPQS